VTNDSGGLSEKWQLSGYQWSLDGGGNGAWSLVPSTNSTDMGLSSYTLQAVFLSSGALVTDCPPLSSGVWTNQGIGTMTLVTTGGVQYGTAGSGNNFEWYASPYVTASGLPAAQNKPDNALRMYPAAANQGKRALCWKVIGPSSVLNQDQQNIQLLITAQP
jgi:hypothetical protein